MPDFDVHQINCRWCGLSRRWVIELRDSFGYCVQRLRRKSIDRAYQDFDRMAARYPEAYAQCS
jgi:hypothetical protein